MSLERDEIGYALAKQLDSAYELQTSYGALRLTSDMRQAVANALRPQLLRLWREAGVVDAGDEPMCMRDICDLVRGDLISRPEFIRDVNELIEKAARALTARKPSNFSPEMRHSIVPRLADKIGDDVRTLALRPTDVLFPPPHPAHIGRS
jgi:hypothetical protein